MDKVAQVAASVSFNPEVVKEPRGFIKFLQFIIAIFAFATTCSVNTQSSLTIQCVNVTNPVTVTVKIAYPFNLHGDNSFRSNPCDALHPLDARPFGDFSPPSQFYVFVGVMAFLYCLAAVILYICFDDKYRKNDKIPMADFIITVVLAVLWLIASAVWAQGVSDVKLYSDPNEISSLHMNNICKLNTCNTSTGNFASLNVSLIFGFLNMAVWASNLWFLYKETAWFKVTTRPPNEPTTEPQFDAFGGNTYQSSPTGYQDPARGYSPNDVGGGYQSRPGPI